MGAFPTACIGVVQSIYRCIGYRSTLIAQIERADKEREERKKGQQDGVEYIDFDGEAIIVRWFVRDLFLLVIFPLVEAIMRPLGVIAKVNDRREFLCASEASQGLACPEHHHSTVEKSALPFTTGELEIAKHPPMLVVAHSRFQGLRAPPGMHSWFVSVLRGVASLRAKCTSV